MKVRHSRREEEGRRGVGGLFHTVVRDGECVRLFFYSRIDLPYTAACYRRF
jgi:hypothetical protein